MEVKPNVADVLALTSIIISLIPIYVVYAPFGEKVLRDKLKQALKEH